MSIHPDTLRDVCDNIRKQATERDGAYAFLGALEALLRWPETSVEDIREVKRAFDEARWPGGKDDGGEA